MLGVWRYLEVECQVWGSRFLLSITLHVKALELLITLIKIRMKKFLLLIASIIFFNVAYSQEAVTCSTCGGTGRIVCVMCGGSGMTYTMFGPTYCFSCGGARSMYCYSCNGAGKIYIPVYTPDYSGYTGGYTGGYTSTYVPETTSSYESHEDHSHSSSSYEYENRYGDKDCPSCLGSGKCSTCNGKGWYDNPFGSGHLDCPNCAHGKPGVCGKCLGKGTVYGLK